MSGLAKRIHVTFRTARDATADAVAAGNEVEMEGLLWFLVIGGLFYFMMRYGCGAHMVHGHEGHAGHAGHGSGAATAVDPVCGMTVAADQGYSKTHQGTLHRFCSRDCLDKFEADPDRYLNPQGSGGAA